MTERFAEIIALINREVKPALGCTEPIAVALAAVRAVEVMEENCAVLRPVSSAGGDSPSHGSGSCGGSKNDGVSPCVSPRNWMDSDDFFIRIEVSGNILKNGMGVGIPGVGMTGLPIAAALGAVCGRSEYGLEVLRDLSEDSVARAKRLVSDGKVKIELAKTDIKLYVRASVSAVVDGEVSAFPSAACSHDGTYAGASSCAGSLHTPAGALHTAVAVILDDHDNIAETWFDGRQLTGSKPALVAPACAAEIPELTGSENSSPQHGDSSHASLEGHSSRDLGLTIRELYDFATTVDFNDIAFILESRTLNLALAREGLTNDYGLKVGKTIHSGVYKEVFGDTFISNAMALTAAATDARMAGCPLPAMSNSGSGNQGITVTMPVIAYAL